MKLTVNLKLLPTEQQRAALVGTLERANAACNAISVVAWERQTFGQFALQKATYHSVKAEFALTAQMVVRCVAKVADAYKLDRKRQRIFRPHGGIAYDDRIIRFKGEAANLWTVEGRLTVPFVCGEHQRRLLTHRKGEVDLILIRGTFYLNVVCDVDEPELIEPHGALGIDLGIVNVATDSDGTVYSGAAVELNRRIFAHRRRNLQRKRTKAATRKLRTLRGQQARFQKDWNHRISKAIVANAKRTGRAIALEQLGGIRDRVTAKRRQRARLANWSFAQIRAFISYKARLAGVPVVLVDPRNTSRTCPACGVIDKASRRSQSQFLCTSCGLAGPADYFAALNISARAAVMQPMVSAGATLPGTSPRL
jgi:IS605 OrfB family transposase